MDSAAAWNSDWAWSLPLIVLSVLIHVIGLGLFNVKMVQVLTVAKDRRYFIYAFALGIGVTTIWATFLHAVEAGLWAAAYRLLGALPDSKSALLYSLSAITTYGHSEIFLTERWRLMGALEALNGIILIGLTTALMYGLIKEFGRLTADRRRGCPGHGEKKWRNEPRRPANYESAPAFSSRQTKPMPRRRRRDLRFFANPGARGTPRCRTAR